eukprot:scaffold7366_cov254-Pinguiococcus_pyrenoidosus.AAC.16
MHDRRCVTSDVPELLAPFRSLSFYPELGGRGGLWSAVRMVLSARERRNSAVRFSAVFSMERRSAAISASAGWNEWCLVEFFRMRTPHELAREREREREHWRELELT